MYVSGATVMATLKLTSVGTSTGVVIPKEMLHRLRVERGDVLHVIETPQGYLLTPFDPAIEAQVAAGRKFMKKYAGSTGGHCCYYMRKA
jgi:putative addiction module antidote